MKHFLTTTILSILYISVYGQIFGPSQIPHSNAGVGGLGHIALPFDVNNDSYLDLVSGFAREQGVYLNDGTNSFENMTPNENLEYPLDIGDMNNDGIIDIYTRTGVYSYINNEIEFLSLYNFPEFHRHITMSDMDNDGFEDILYALDERLFIGYYRNDTIIEVQIGSHPRSYEYVITDDLNNDGLIDIISTSNFSTKDIRVFQNMGDRSFEEKTYPLSGPFFYTWIETGDMNNDGFNDLIYGGSDSIYVRVNENMSFDKITSIIDAEVVNGKTGDINNDGLIDLVYIDDITDDNLAYALNNGDMTFSISYFDFILGAGTSWTESQSFEKWTQLADLDNDGDLDLLVLDDSYNRFYIYENDIISNTVDVDNTSSMITVNPNPGRNQVKIDSKDYPITVTDINGTILHTIYKKGNINLHHWSPGIYFLTNEKGASTYLIKQ